MQNKKVPHHQILLHNQSLFHNFRTIRQGLGDITVNPTIIHPDFRFCVFQLAHLFDGLPCPSVLCQDDIVLATLLLLRAAAALA